MDVNVDQYREGGKWKLFRSLMGENREVTPARTDLEPAPQNILITLDSNSGLLGRLSRTSSLSSTSYTSAS